MYKKIKDFSIYIFLPEGGETWHVDRKVDRSIPDGSNVNIRACINMENNDWNPYSTHNGCPGRDN